MFIKNTLIKSINAYYFRHLQDQNWDFPIDLDVQSCYLDKIILADGNNGDLDFQREVQDLITILDDSLSPYFSTVAKDAEQVRYRYQQKIFKALQKNKGAMDVINILKDKIGDTYVVGGFCRDTIIGKRNKDIDFVSDIPYDALKQIFENHGYETKETGEHFLVLNIIKDGNQFEISNFRKEGTYVDGRRPESVDIGDMFDDGFRRDFTVNALYYDIKTTALLDPTGLGIPDINENTLRFIGKPKDRIEEDYLRVFRFYRFIAKGFNADPKALKAVRTHFKDALAKTASERIKVELERTIGIL